MWTKSPLGRTPRSNPATYTGVFSDIRDLFVGLPEAKIRGYKAERSPSTSVADAAKLAKAMGTSALR